MRICIFSRPFHPAVGGLEQIAKTLAIEFCRLQHEVLVVTDTPSTVSDDKQFPFKIIRTRKLWQRYKAFTQADVILFMNFTFAGVPAAMFARKPIVLSHHGIYQVSGAATRRLIEWTKAQLTRCFYNISVSNFVARHIPGSSVVISNAYDNDLFKSATSLRQRDFVFCGRLVSEKGANVLISAFAMTLKRFPEATLTIVGDGPEKPALEEQAKIEKCSDNIVFSGVLRGKALADKLTDHVCMIVPSLLHEAFGIVALEGIASCETVIVSNRGGLPEAVGSCGMVIEPTPGSLAQAMCSVLLARTQGLPMPGQVSTEERTRHLEKHTPRYVAQKYLASLRSKAVSR